MIHSPAEGRNSFVVYVIPIHMQCQAVSRLRSFRHIWVILVVGRGGFAAVADELKAPNHFANCEEAQALGGNNTSGGQLGAAHDGGGFLGKLGSGLRGGLEERAGVLPYVLEVGLEVGLEGFQRPVRDVSVEADSQSARPLISQHLRRRHLLSTEDDLGDLGADLGVVDDGRSLLWCHGQPFAPQSQPTTKQPAELARNAMPHNDRATEGEIPQERHILSTKATAVAVRPPTLLSELATPLAAPAMAGPAAAETLDRPSWALDAYSDADAAALEAALEALSWALEAYSDADAAALEAPSFADSAAFAEVDSNRRAAMRLQAPDCRSTGRARADDMVARGKWILRDRAIDWPCGRSRAVGGGREGESEALAGRRRQCWSLVVSR